MSDNITVTCPHCEAVLEIDAEAGVVVSHRVPERKGEKVDFDARLQKLQDDRRRAEDRMAEAMRAERSRDRLLEDRFRKLMEGAKDDDGTPPGPRDIDLD